MIISQVSYRTNGPLVVCWHTRVQLLLQIFSDAVRLPGDLQFQGNIIEPRREKTGLRGFRPGLTQTGLYKLRKELEA